MPHPGNDRRRQIALRVVGWLFVVLGVAGLFLPFLQGILFLLVGLYLLSLVSPRARLLRQRLRQRFPKAARGLDEAEAWIKRQWARLRPTQQPARQEEEA